MCRKTEADLCCIYLFMMFHFYIGIYHKKNIYVFFCQLSFMDWTVSVKAQLVCVCVIVLQVDLEQL